SFFCLRCRHPELLVYPSPEHHPLPIPNAPSMPTPETTLTASPAPDDVVETNADTRVADRRAVGEPLGTSGRGRGVSEPVEEAFGEGVEEGPGGGYVED